MGRGPREESTDAVGVSVHIKSFGGVAGERQHADGNKALGGQQSLGHLIGLRTTFSSDVSCQQVHGNAPYSGRESARGPWYRGLLKRGALGRECDTSPSSNSTSRTSRTSGPFLLPSTCRRIS